MNSNFCRVQWGRIIDACRHFGRRGELPPDDIFFSRLVSLRGLNTAERAFFAAEEQIVNMVQACPPAALPQAYGAPQPACPPQSVQGAHADRQSLYKV